MAAQMIMMAAATARRVLSARSLAPLLLSLLAACSTAGPTPAPAPAVPTSCPENLSAVKSKLVTPYDKLASFIGPDELEATLTKPVDEMIARGGGFAPSIASGEEYVKEYNAILADEKGTRNEYRAMGQTEEWIDLYLSSVRDGVTINQAFVDAVRCKQAMAQGQPQS
jgi:hypothetical protein